MSEFKMSEQALRDVVSFHPAQVVFFAMSSRAKGAIVHRAYISKSAASASARGVGGCVRVGRVTGGTATTF